MALVFYVQSIYILQLILRFIMNPMSWDLEFLLLFRDDSSWEVGNEELGAIDGMTDALALILMALFIPDLSV